METKQNFEVSPVTGYYLSALRAYEALKSSYLSALCNEYGEEQGCELFTNDVVYCFDDVRAKILERLYKTISDNMANRETPNLI